MLLPALWPLSKSGDLQLLSPASSTRRLLESRFFFWAGGRRGQDLQTHRANQGRVPGSGPQEPQRRRRSSGRASHLALRPDSLPTRRTRVPRGLSAVLRELTERHSGASLEPASFHPILQLGGQSQLYQLLRRHRVKSSPGARDTPALSPRGRTSPDSRGPRAAVSDTFTRTQTAPKVVWTPQTSLPPRRRTPPRGRALDMER